MKRRDFLLAGSALAAAELGLGLGPALAAPAKRILMVTWRGETDVERGFRDYLKRRGAPVELIARDASRDPKRLEAIAAEVAGLKPDLVYAWGTSTTLGLVGKSSAPLAALGDIPLVFALVADAVGAGIVPSLSNQGRNITGVGHMAPIAAQLEAIRRYRPFQKLGILYNPFEENSVANVRDLKAQSATLKFDLLEQTFDRLAEGKPTNTRIPEKMQALRSAGAQWLYIGPDSYLTTQLPAVASAAREAGLPTFCTTEAVISTPDDILAGLVSPYREVGEFAAHKAYQILFEGRPAASLPVETLRRFSLVVRMDVAKKMDFLPPLEFYDYAEMRQGGHSA